MQPSDLRAFCLALGFTAIVIKGQPEIRDSAAQAREFARLIENFCLSNTAVNENGSPALDALIEEIKSGLRSKGEADLHYERGFLLRLYDRLHERYAANASDDMIADRVLDFIDREIEADGEAKS